MAHLLKLQRGSFDQHLSGAVGIEGTDNHYATDVSDAAWALLAHFHQRARPGGRSRTTDIRAGGCSERTAEAHSAAALFERQFLHPVVADLRHIKLVGCSAVDLVDRTEFLGQFSRPAKLADDRSVQFQLVDLSAAVGIFVPDLPAPIALDYAGAPSVVVANLQLFAMPGLAPGEYQFTLTATPLAGSNSAPAVSLPVVLTVTSGAQAAWEVQ